MFRNTLSLVYVESITMPYVIVKTRVISEITLRLHRTVKTAPNFINIV